jgi:hypothetical protein
MHVFEEWTAGARERFARWLKSADLVRTGLVGGTAALLTTAFAALLFLSPERISGLLPGGEETGADEIVESRLPRPRPNDSPLTTGSIAPASPEAPEPAEIPRLANNRRFDDLQTRAILIASSWSECDEVRHSELFELPDGAPEEILIRIHCANGTQFVLGEADVAANRIEPAPRPAPVAAVPPAPAAPPQAAIPTIYEPAVPTLTDADILRACEEKVRLGLPFPDSLSRNFSATGVSRLPNGAVVTFDFNALNGFGFPLFMRAECVIENREVARLELTPR